MITEPSVNLNASNVPLNENPSSQSANYPIAQSTTEIKSTSTSNTTNSPENTTARLQETPKIEPSTLPTDESKFPEEWDKMLDIVFQSMPTISLPLKGIYPLIVNNVVQLYVKNDIQKEHFEMRQREVLEYLRNNYSNSIENIIVTVNENIETKKVIYDTSDKMKNFQEQNDQFEDFIKTLEIRIKD